MLLVESNYINMIKVINVIIPVLAGTPLYAWGILAYLVFIGIKATKRRTFQPMKLFIMPIIFIGINYKLIPLADNLGTYIFSLVTGCLTGFTIGLKTPIKIYQDLKLIELPGNYYTISLLLLFFVIKYTIGYFKATDPSMFGLYLYIDSLISGLISGYFYGTSSSYLIRYFQKSKIYLN